mmetsp:Transcript_4662/g.10266  ORF Transcript_4662/g.10266 Transcript_4662/m.10266 type:complete len:263 (+) Transcript_4662:647-1435(+)
MTTASQIIDTRRRSIHIEGLRGKEIEKVIEEVRIPILPVLLETLLRQETEQPHEEMEESLILVITHIVVMMEERETTLIPHTPENTITIIRKVHTSNTTKQITREAYRNKFSRIKVNHRIRIIEAVDRTNEMISANLLYRLIPRRVDGKEALLRATLITINTPMNNTPTIHLATNTTILTFKTSRTFALKSPRRPIFPTVIECGKMFVPIRDRWNPNRIRRTLTREVNRSRKRQSKPSIFRRNPLVLRWRMKNATSPRPGIK